VKISNDLVTSAKALIWEVPVTQAEEVIRNANVLCDVRETEEFVAGHIPVRCTSASGMITSMRKRPVWFFDAFQRFPEQAT
jgi:hypothetical protein